MTKFLIGLLTGIALAILSLVIIGFSLARLGDRKPVIPDNATLVIRLDGEVPEKAPMSVPLPFVGTEEVATVRDLWMTLRKAAADKRIKAVVLEPAGMDVGWAKADELRNDLLQFKKSGKPLYAYLRRPRTRDYYLASAADRIYMSPEDVLDVKGLRAELMYFRNTLDKIGVQMQVYHIGKYKNAGDMFTQTTATPETREVMNSVLDTVYAYMVEVFAKSRHKGPEEMRALIDKGPFLAEQAKQFGLVDDLRYEDQLFGEIKDRLKQTEVKKVSHTQYMRVPGSSVGLDGRKNIAFVVGEGTIVSGSGSDAMGDEGFSSGAFIKLLREVAGDKSIDGVILRIDSPGGDAIASDEILREVKLLRDKKPMVISMSDLAASGGYYVSMTGDPMLAYPLTYTGSIGIVYGRPNLKGLYDKLGITKDILTRGQNAAIDTDYGPMSAAAKVKTHEILEQFYQGFVGRAAASRRMTYEQLEPLAQGRVWLGSQAKANHLIDDLGGIDRAVELVKKKANIAPGETVRLIPYPPRRSIFDQLFKPQSDSVLDSKLRQALKPLDYRLWTHGGGYLRIVPYWLTVE